MKTAIIFYSFSGNTRKACQFIRDKLTGKQIDTDWRELKLEREERSFIKQCFDARFKKTPALSGVDCDVSSCDYIIFASPVWAFTFAPALRSFLSKVSGLQNKKTAFWFTHGSSAGVRKALSELGDLLKEKGAQIQFSKSISGAGTKYDNYLQEQLQPLIDTIKSN